MRSLTAVSACSAAIRVCERIEEVCQANNPLLTEEGWLRQVRKCREATEAAQTGVAHTRSL